MYAVPARRNGKTIQVNVNCFACGELMLFSHDKIEGEYSHRYVSCANRHSVVFAVPGESTKPIECDEPGFLIDGTKPDWDRDVPNWVASPE